MQEPTRRRPGPARAAGFTMAELAVVVGIIALMAAVSLPSLAAYLRNYTIETAAKNLASEIQAARYKAISRNVNVGVLLVVEDNSSYRWVIEDDVDPQNPPPFQPNLGTLLTQAAYVNQRGARHVLPTGVVFDATGATDPAFRYNRFGGWCQPGVDVDCPAIVGFAGTRFVNNTASGAQIVMRQASTGLMRRIRVGTGGRVIIERF